MDNSPAEHPVYEVIARIDSGWRLKKFDRFDECFDENAVIVGPGHTELARGRKKCAKSYRDFAASGAVLSFSESSHTLHTWETIAVYTFAWKMHYQRHAGAKHESGGRPTRLRADQGSAAAGLALHLLRTFAAIGFPVASCGILGTITA